jgi:hypothetical protein
MAISSRANDLTRPSGRLPPDYTRRSVKLRLFFLLAAIMAIAAVIEKRGDFLAIARLWDASASANAAKFDNRLREADNRTVADPVGTFVAEPDSKADAADLQAVRDDTPLFRPAEREAWFAEVARVREADLAQLAGESLGAVGYLQLHKQPGDYRGRVVTVRGTARLAYRTPAPANDSGVKQYCVYILQPIGGPDAPIFVYALAAPAGLPRLGADAGDPAGKMREEVSVTGVFFKRCAYAAPGGTYTAPVLIAKVPEWHPAPAARGEASAPTTVWELTAAAVGALLIASCIAAVVWKRTGGNRHAESRADGGGFVDLGPIRLAPTVEERLAELEQQARAEGEPR